ncbi:hypothetical protein LJC58_09210, partial [Lachnospiraceae bacterium OttesenSCG-928-D06]|nr:hypothetical protein [Lachnospiraceae bacterium OttesenSCG-928-D06]
TEQGLLDMFIQERINMLLSNLSKTRPKKTPEENERILQAEHIIDNLPEEERKMLQSYIDNFTDLFAVNEPFLYRQGFLDGIRVTTYFTKL